jgi:class 3 adenylate cyclase
VRACGGREVKHTGDGIMASFQSVPDAVTCAVSVQEAFAEHNRQAPSDGLILRIGLHAGEPIEEHGDLFGNAVNLAARLCTSAGPSEILVSETIREMPMSWKCRSRIGEPSA